MSSRWAIYIGAVAIGGIGLLLWPIFVEGEPILIVALALFLVAGVALVIAAARSPRRVFQYALLGIPIGFVLGGVGLFALVRAGSSDGDGWADLVAVIAGILGAFVGSILGGAVGAAVGARRDRRDNLPVIDRLPATPPDRDDPDRPV